MATERSDSPPTDPAKEPILLLPKAEYRKTLESAATKSKALFYQAAPENFSAFCRAVLKDERTQERIVPQPIHLEWFKHIDRCLDEGMWPGILAPPESGKSQNIAIGLPLWWIGNEPTTRAAIICSDEGMSKKRVRPAKDYVQRDPDYRVIFPEALPDHPDKWTELEFSIRRPGGIKDPSVRGYGIVTPPRGARIDLAIFDDVCTIKNTIMEPAMRPKLVDLFYEGYDDRFSPQSFVVYIGGVVHNQDLTSYLLKDPRFWFIMQSIGPNFDCIIQTDMRTGEVKELPLWSRSWTPEFLRKKHEANPRAFARAFRHQGYDDEERTFQEDWIENAITFVDDPTEVPEGAWTVCGMDIAGKKRRGSALVPVSQKGKSRLVHDCELGRWNGKQKAEHLIAMKQKYRTVCEVVENNATQQDTIDLIEIISDVHMNIHPFMTGKQKVDEELGIPGLAAEFAQGRWKILFPHGHKVGMGCKCGRCMLVQQLRDHPFGDVDTVMGLWFARFGLNNFANSGDMEWSEGKFRSRDKGLREKRGNSRLQRFRNLRKGGRK